MKNIPNKEYGELKKFLIYFSEKYMDLAQLPKHQRPVSILETLENKSMSMAFRGLKQAINDCVEMSKQWEYSQIQRIDNEFVQHGIITLSELRRRFSKDYSKVLTRGEISSATEYYLIKGVLEDSTSGADSDERAKLQSMLEFFEENSR